MAEILFKSHLVNESIKLKVGKRNLRKPGLHALSARSKLESTVSCDVTEFQDFARTWGQERTPGNQAESESTQSST